MALRSSSSPPLRSPAEDDDGMVFLPHASPFVASLCICLYATLAFVAFTRSLFLSSTSPSSSASSSSTPSSSALLRRRADALKRQQTFQRLLVVFALLRALSLVLEEPLARGLLNRLALCVFFSLVLFQVLFWIDIANPKLSTRSRRIWNAFLGANALFYAIVLGLFWLMVRENALLEASPRTPLEQIERARLWDLLPVLFIAMGSFAASLGLLYSTCTTRRRVGRVLRQLTTQSLPQRLNDRVHSKLQRALRVTNLVMGVCCVLFLMRTILYVQRPFSHQECGAIRDPNACLLLGYGLPELVPCALFLMLMWEVEPQLELQAGRRKSSINALAVARASETTPLLPVFGERHQSELTVDVSSLYLIPSHGTMHQATPTRTQRASPLSSGLGGSAIAAARRRLRRVLEESFGMRSEDESSTQSAAHKRVASGASGRSDSPPHSRSSSDRRDPAFEADAATRLDETESMGASPISVFVWMSFQCFRLKLPSTTEPAVVLVLHHVDPVSGETTTEIGRTEVAYSSDPSFHVMLPIEIHESLTLRASVFAVTQPKALHDLNAQWLIGNTLLPLVDYMSCTADGLTTVIPGTASVHELRSPLSRTHASGELVVRCEAPLPSNESVAVETERLQRITRAFVYQPSANAASVLSPKSAAASACRSKLLVEEELIESVFTWEMPYQLLQLILSDLLVQLDVLKRALTESSEALSSQEEEKDTVMTGGLQAATNRAKTSASVGMLSEMIMQIQGDAMERKSKKWGEMLVVKTEKYIDEVEAAILRYENANLGGLTFKPSTMKADSGLSFLALNLHQQLISVGNAVTASTRDVVAETDHRSARRFDPEHYVKLIDSSAIVAGSSSPSLRIMEVEHGRTTSGHSMFDDSASEDDDELVEEEAAAPQSQEEEPRSRTPEPFEALRRRVISFDSAETIVNMHVFGGAKGVPLSREQRQLAETIVALGIENALDAEGSEEAEHEPDAFSPGSASETFPVRMSTTADRVRSRDSFDGAVRGTFGSPPAAAEDLASAHCEPFADHEMYGTTTVGAFAAHVYGFRKGGIRQLRGELKKLSERMAREAERVGSELTVEGLEREYVELKWHIDRRLEVTFCQSMSALATCFQQTLYVHLHERGCARGSQIPRVRGLQYLEQLADIGFVFSVESLLSTYSKEAGMLGDMEAAVRELERVRIKLRPVQSPRAAQFRVSVTSGPQGLTMELPLIVVPPEQHKARTMHRVLGQDASTGAVYVSLGTPEQWARARKVFRRPIAVVPVLFSQGMNEMQTVANTVGKDALQKEINSENLVVLERHVDAFAAWWRANMTTKSVSINNDEGEDDQSTDEGPLRRLGLLRAQLRDHVQRSGRGKHMDILTLSSAIARLVGGGRVTCCKSAKDRTAMSVTLEEASLLVNAHGLRVSDKELFTALLRTYGVRRENARKNIGQAQYCFSALQNYLLPADYQCPPGTGGGGRALS